MDFLRLHLPGLHQALRGALDSLSSFVSYLMGDEVPTADRKEERAAEELGEVAAGRQGKPEKKEAQEALEGLGGSQSQEDGGLRGPREAGICQEGSSATEQTWACEEGSSHRSQAERQDTGVQEAAKAAGVQEAAKAARCQEPRAHLEARKESEAGSEAGRDNSSEAQESQGPSEQEVKREETLRTREQEEEAEEVRERKPEVARKAESEWTWHREPEGVVGADGQKVAGDSRESLEPVKEAIAEEIHGSAAKQAGQEEELMVVLRGSEGPRAQEAQESGTECEDRTTSVREEDWTASGREEDGKTSSREEDGTASGREEDWTASGREEDGTASGREEDGTASGREEDGTASGRVEDGTFSGREEDGPASDSGEDRTVSGREEDGTTSCRKEDWTASGREEDGAASSREEDGPASGREEDGPASDSGEDRTASGREEDSTALEREEDRTTSGREEDWTASGREEDGTASGREEDGTASGREEDGTTSGREEAGTATGREEDGTASSREEDGPASDSGEDRTASGREEDSTVLEREEDWTTSGREEDGTASGREEDSIALEREEARTTIGREEDGTASGREEDGTASGREEDSTALEREEAKTTTGREEDGTASGREEENRTASGSEEAGITLGRVEARTTSVGKEGDLSEARTTEYGEVSGEKTSEGTGKTWAFEEASRGEQEEEVDENREAEMSFPPKQTRVLGTESVEEPAKEQRAGVEAEEGQGSEGEVREGFEVQEDQGGKEAEGKQTSVIRTVPARLEEEVAAEKAKEEEEGCRVSEAELPKDNLANEPEEDADFEVTPEASSPEKESSQERSDGEAQTGGEAQGCSGAGWGDLEHEVMEGREPELVAGSQTLVEQPEEELWGASALSKEETGGSPEEYPSNMGGLVGAEAWENQRRDVERGDTGEEKADAEEGEVAGGQAPEESEGGRESTFPDVPEAGGEWKKTQEIGAEEGETLGAESQELGGRHGADAGTGQSLGESDGGETKDEEVEAAVPWGADPTPSGDGRLEEATLSLQDSEDPGASSLAAEIARDDVALDGRAAGVEGGPAREAGEAWGSEGRQEVRGGVELMEVTQGENRGWLGFGSEGSADEKAAGRGAQAEALEAREGEPRGEWVEVREPAVEEGSCGMDGFTSGSQVVRAEGTVATREAEGLLGGQTLLKEEAVGWQMKEQGQDSEGGCGDHRPEEEAGRPLDVEDAEETEDRRAEAEDIVPGGLEDVQGQEDQSTSQEPAETELGPHREMGETAESAGGGACGLWSEALLPGALLDVSAPRSRVLLSRNSSLRRSRPSFRRTRAPERQEVPPSPPPEEQLSAPEQRLLQAEEPPEPRPPKPEGTPLPARRRPLGRGFGLAHMGMMQELQARLGQPKPQ
ncbi:apolipoprotein B receptor [Enhydra lutris kenyoni]|uniref:Apolipoprotein B receptor n=1 Tax=Enhydra lutris kenyoni TaxID=391180 RepID=A0A2Y9L887_ENHLU|nr:apolipoprotein B receptor [Enhydra lutris kenyoni]